MRIIALFFTLLFTSLYSFAQNYEEFIEKSYDYLENDNLPAAEESLRAAMRLEPANPYNYALLSNLGTIQRRQEKYEDAMISYQSAFSRRPQDITLLGNIASLYATIGEADKAIDHYNILLSVDKNNQDAIYNRGLLFMQKKDFIGAEEDFDKLLEINEKTFLGRLGHAILEKMRGNYNESERIYNYLINEFPKSWPLYEGRAELYFMMNKNTRAMSDINKFFAEVENPPASLYVLRGKIKIAQYEKPSARLDFQRAKDMGYDPEIIKELMKMCM
jgi:Tetratricopeptide repeat.